RSVLHAPSVPAPWLYRSAGEGWHGEACSSLSRLLSLHFGTSGLLPRHPSSHKTLESWWQPIPAPESSRPAMCDSAPHPPALRADSCAPRTRPVLSVPDLLPP